MPDDEREDRIQDARPRFVIPYWTATPGDPGDTGDDRPLPANRTWYLCSGIRTSTYQPGEVLEVAVDVRNLGGSNAPSLAQVTVWWSDPTLGFVIKPENLIGFRTVSVDPRGGSATTALMAKQIPGSAPDHICLLARVSHRLDGAPPMPDPVNDRHWAQRNLSVVKAPPGGSAVTTFSVANVLADAFDFQVAIRPLRNPAQLAQVDGVEGRPTDSFAVFTVDDMTAEGSLEFGVTLEPDEQRSFRTEVRVPDLALGSYVAFEISQSLGDMVLGGIGLVVLGTTER
jgi:hypothetical protein